MAEILLGNVSSRCYLQLVTLIRLDQRVAGMQTASPAALSWLESVIKTQELSTATSHDFGQPRCFRSPRYDLSALPMGERPDRKQGPENKSHKNLNIYVSAARDVR